MLGTNANHPFRSWVRRVSGSAEAIARDLPETAWTRLSAGEGTKGARLHDWYYLPLVDLDAGECDDPPGPWTPGPWRRGLLVRRHVADGSMAFFSTWCPLGTSLEPLVVVEGRRWTIEDAFETAKNELSLDHNETRSWHGWHRHDPRHDRLGASAGVVEGVGPEELAGRHGAFDLVASFRSAETAPSRQVQALNI